MSEKYYWLIHTPVGKFQLEIDDDVTDEDLQNGLDEFYNRDNAMSVQTTIDGERSFVIPVEVMKRSVVELVTEEQLRKILED